MDYHWCPLCGYTLDHDYERDSYCCRKCESRFDGESLTLDLESRIVDLEQKIREMEGK